MVGVTEGMSRGLVIGGGRGVEVDWADCFREWKKVSRVAGREVYGYSWLICREERDGFEREEGEVALVVVESDAGGRRLEFGILGRGVPLVAIVAAIFLGERPYLYLTGRPYAVLPNV